MPRGRRKLGQATIAIWFPDGSRYEEKTTENMGAAEFAENLAGMIERAERALAVVRQQAAAGGAVAGQPAQAHQTSEAGRGD